MRRLPRHHWSQVAVWYEGIIATQRIGHRCKQSTGAGPEHHCLDAMTGESRLNALSLRKVPLRLQSMKPKRFSRWYRPRQHQIWELSTGHLFMRYRPITFVLASGLMEMKHTRHRNMGSPCRYLRSDDGTLQWKSKVLNDIPSTPFR